MTITRLTGWRAFLSLWTGQTVSAVGSGLFAFGVGVYVYQRTGSATLFALVMAFDLLPGILVAPYIGVLIDKVDRRLGMVVGNALCGISTLLVALVIATGFQHVWLLYPPLVLGAVAGAFLGSAYEASVSLLIPEEHLGRANGLLQTGQALSEVVAPLAAGVLLITIGVVGMIVIDFGTFLVAILTLLVISLPRPSAEEDEEEEGDERFWRQVTFGLRFIRGRSALLTLLLTLTVLNFFIGMSGVAATPLVLSFASPAVLGTVFAIGGAGMLVGGLVMSAWGGTRRRVVGLLGGLLLAGVFMMLYGVRPNPIPVAIGAFGFFFLFPIVAASSSAIWQAQVPREMQGRVFAVRRMVALGAAPVAYVVTGPLIDYVFRPLLAPGTQLASLAAPLVGTGPGRGIGLLYMLMGLCVVLVTAAAVANPRVRGVEGEAPAGSPAASTAAG
jgi:DHA3 family macrolide efflux protein-like MFS transporter